MQKYTALATEVCPSLKDKRVTPHVLRHAAAMTLLQSGVDCAVIALWLGHESIETTQIYLHADLQLKEKAMDQTKPVGVPSGRYQPPDELMQSVFRLTARRRPAGSGKACHRAGD